MGVNKKMFKENEILKSTTLTTNLIQGLLLLMEKKNLITTKEMIDLLAGSVELTAQQQNQEKEQEKAELLKEFEGVNKWN